MARRSLAISTSVFLMSTGRWNPGARQVKSAFLKAETPRFGPRPFGNTPKESPNEFWLWAGHGFRAPRLHASVNRLMYEANPYSRIGTFNNYFFASGPAFRAK